MKLEATGYTLWKQRTGRTIAEANPGPTKTPMLVINQHVLPQLYGKKELYSVFTAGEHVILSSMNSIKLTKSPNRWQEKLIRVQTEENAMYKNKKNIETIINSCRKNLLTTEYYQRTKRTMRRHQQKAKEENPSVTRKRVWLYLIVRVETSGWCEFSLCFISVYMNICMNHCV